ncbi:MAG: TIGR01777 family oxidoreductase [Sediminibacterium sp.]|uniref:TIGR01777 family oxidoreductase n=1 Tax=Sediminibacterium sp. TaxID=1917865 RepID=UPI002ABC4927|nr:TIGR01777 family oxidoreductase [Sediminibacterium sp.]MDZ4071863.1 TIGR01777 family oxidoreductase [Sediminibacterium sp.]
MATILITGGTGMVGQQLTRVLLSKGYDVIWLSRASGKKEIDGKVIRIASWNLQEQTIDETAIQQADHIIHLAGAGVADKRWTAKRKQEILDSRTQSSALLVKALQTIPNKVQSVISASAIGWYGPDEDNTLGSSFTEDMPAYPDYLGSTCKAWEESITPVTELGKRLVKLRIGIVLSTTGGALAEFKKPLKGGMAAILGSGKQMISWIHVHDLCRMFLYAIENQSMQGTFNAVAPHPVSNKELTLTLAKQKNGSFYIPFYVPAFLLKMILGEMSIEVLKSATVSSRKIEEQGFRFEYATIQQALRDL